jgi:hypothetical protein
MEENKTMTVEIEQRHYEEMLAKKDMKLNKVSLENAALKEKLAVFMEGMPPSFAEMQRLMTRLQTEKANLLGEVARLEAQLKMK